VPIARCSLVVSMRIVGDNFLVIISKLHRQPFLIRLSLRHSYKAPALNLANMRIRPITRISSLFCIFEQQ
jgi:hypothetical protein